MRGACVRDLWCRCDECYSKNIKQYYKLDQTHHKKKDKRRRGAKRSSSGQAVLTWHDQAWGKAWAHDRRLDYRCVECGWWRAWHTDGPVRIKRKFGELHSGIRQAVCPKCRALRDADIRRFLEQWGLFVLTEHPDVFLRTGRGRRPDEHRAHLSYAIAMLDIAGATRQELVEATGLSAAAISRHLSTPSVPTPAVVQMHKLFDGLGAFGRLGQTGTRRVAGLEAARGVRLHPGGVPVRSIQEEDVETALTRIEGKIDDGFKRVENKLDLLIELIWDARNGLGDPDALHRATDEFIADVLHAR